VTMPQAAQSMWECSNAWEEIIAGGPLVSITVRNSGSPQSRDTVQVYASQPKQLRRFAASTGWLSWPQRGSLYKRGSRPIVGCGAGGTLKQTAGKTCVLAAS
jgi:hypothetical protein